MLTVLSLHLNLPGALEPPLGDPGLLLRAVLELELTTQDQATRRVVGVVVLPAVLGFGVGVEVEDGSG